MITLSGRTKPTALANPIHPDIWRVCRATDDPAGLPLACLADDEDEITGAHQLYLTRSPCVSTSVPALLLPPELAHLTPGDIIVISADGCRLTVIWKSTATHNSLLLTEQCDNYCLMCSQPPKTRDDSWLFDRAKRIVSLLPPSAHSLGLTGGEPTLHADALINLLEHCASTAPWVQLHLLSNGRQFANPSFTRRYANTGNADIMVGIPLYAPEPGLHDYIVQANGAFNETIHGILNLAALGQRTEIRIVIQRHTVPILHDLAVFITRNLPFIEQVALMGLEMTGLARPNTNEVWIDPADYQPQLAQATRILDSAHITTKIYNHQLCVLDEQLWPFAVRSISDWKNDYLDICHNCSVRDTCGGIFTTSGTRLSKHLHTITSTAHPTPSC
jgi:His-Xaa-Ser system radical SAM maturase HxsC